METVKQKKACLAKQARFHQWLFAAGEAMHGKMVSCPSCAAGSVHAQIIGDVETRAGWGVAWCDACSCGVHLCRLRVPDGVEMLPFDAPPGALKDKLPDKIDYMKPC